MNAFASKVSKGHFTLQQLTCYFCLLIGGLLLSASELQAQQLPSQIIRGTVIDADSQLPLIGVNVVVSNTEPLIGAVTDINGNFKLTNVPVGRNNLLLTYLGYQTQQVPNIVVNAGKETVLELRMREATTELEEVVVTAFQNRGAPTNEMALLSARSISTEEINRLTASFNDPAIITTNFAGVTNSGSGANDIIVRGNSPKYLQWRLEGAPITNPNHFADQNTALGATSTLNANLLAPSDFYTAAFPAEFGNALSGIYDIRLRNGNNEQFEGIAGIGLLGTELTLEGPIRADYEGSFLVNYRYSTASILNNAGLIDVTGEPNFQDAAFKLFLPTEKAGIFSLFGLGGHSTTTFENLTIKDWDVPGDAGMREDVYEDYDKTTFLLNTGLNHTLSIGKRGFLKSSLSFSTEGIDEDVWQKADSLAARTPSFTSELRRSSYRASSKYQHKINAHHTFQTGATYTLFAEQADQQQQLSSDGALSSTLAFEEQMGNLRTFISWKYRPTDALTIVAGLHNNNVFFNEAHTLEPRFSARWQAYEKGALSVGYGLHSSMERIHHYFAQVADDNGSLRQPNLDLGLLKAHHIVVGFEHRFTDKLVANIETYYQHLYDLPVANEVGNYFATINEGHELDYYDLVNEGSGDNFGIEFSLQRFFANDYYFLTNVSLYESTYKTMDGVERNTRFNGNYVLNLIGGKEFSGLGKLGNKTLGLNARFVFSGGQRIIPLLRDANGNLAVDPANNNFWDYERAFESSLGDISQLTLSASYKVQRKRTTHELFINLENILNEKGKLTEYYDASEPEQIGYTTQFGLLPNMMYRIYF